MAKKVKTDYILPSANAVALITELADQLADHMIADKQNRFGLYVLIAVIRRAHLNKKTDTYGDGFEDWYRKNALKQVFGETGASANFHLLVRLSLMSARWIPLKSISISRLSPTEFSTNAGSFCDRANDLESIMSKSLSAA